MRLGYEFESNDSSEHEDAPSQMPMKAGKEKDLRNPTTDQKKVRRQMTKKAEGLTTAMRENPMTEAELLIAMASAPSIAEAHELADQLNQIRSQRTASIAAERELAFDISVDRPQSSVMHGLYRTASDWIMDDQTDFDPQLVGRQMLTEASLWFTKTSVEVKEDRDEFAQQAMGQARKVASHYGEAYEVAQRTFLDHVGFLHTRHAVTAADGEVHPPENSQSGYGESAVTDYSLNDQELQPMDNFVEPVKAEEKGSDEAPIIAENQEESPEKTGKRKTAQQKIADGEVNWDTGEVMLWFANDRDLSSNTQGMGFAGDDLQQIWLARNPNPTVNPENVDWDEVANDVNEMVDAVPAMAGAPNNAFASIHEAEEKDDHDQSGDAVSTLPDVEVGGANDKPLWPWEVNNSETTGTGAADVASVPTPGGPSGYPQPTASLKTASEPSSWDEAYAAGVNDSRSGRGSLTLANGPDWYKNNLTYQHGYDNGYSQDRAGVSLLQGETRITDGSGGTHIAADVEPKEAQITEISTQSDKRGGSRQGQSTAESGIAENEKLSAFRAQVHNALKEII